MITKANIIDFTQRVRRHARRLPDRRLMHPEREWLIGLSLLIGIVLVGGALALIQFTSYLNLDSQVKVAPPTMTVLQLGELEAARTLMQDRTEAFLIQRQNMASAAAVVAAAPVPPLDEQPIPSAAATLDQGAVPVSN